MAHRLIPFAASPVRAPRRRRAACVAPWAVLALVACSRTPVAPRPFTIVRTSPALGAEAEPLLLNDSITLYFADPLQSLSVTGDSVTLVDEGGRQVPGQLRSGANWVTFVPTPPLLPSLDDGSFRPGGRYRLLVAGAPRPDAVCSADGRRLQAAASFEIRVAGGEVAAAGPVPLLRPQPPELPFVLRAVGTPQVVPADAPVLRLHFTLPVLPTTLSPRAFDIRVLRGNEAVQLRARSARLTTSRFDEFPGCTVELDLGAVPDWADGRPAEPLRAGDLGSVDIARDGGLTDYAGNAPLPASPVTSAQVWNVVAGSTIALVEWPGKECGGDDPLWPGFEIVSGSVRPRVRSEAGDGRLGVFRPQRDTVLRPGQPFDRGDGTLVTSVDGTFAFLAIDIAEGVTVTVDASQGPVRLLACGGIQVLGHLATGGAAQPLRVRRYGAAAVRDLLTMAPTALVAAGDVIVRGRITTSAALAADATGLLIASAGRMHLHGELPYNTILGVESSLLPRDEPAVLGTPGQVVMVPATFTYGLAPGAAFEVRGATPWLALPADRDGGTVRLFDASPTLRIGWQAAPPDPVRKGQPDLQIGRVGRLAPVHDEERILVGLGGFVRFELAAALAAGQPLPGLRELRLIDR